MSDPACAHCGASTTTRRYFPSLLGWFCVDEDGASCDARKRGSRCITRATCCTGGPMNEPAIDVTRLPRVYPVFATRDWRLPDGTLVATTYLNDAVISLPDTPVLQYIDRDAFCDTVDVSPPPPAALPE